MMRRMMSLGVRFLFAPSMAAAMPVTYGVEKEVP